MQDNKCPDCPPPEPVRAWLSLEPEIEVYCTTCGRVQDWSEDNIHRESLVEFLEV